MEGKGGKEQFQLNSSTNVYFKVVCQWIGATKKYLFVYQ